MPIRENLTGRRFGKLVVIEWAKSFRSNNKKTFWKCLCDCGKETFVRADMLKSGNTKSCGCGMHPTGPLTHGETAYGKTSKLYSVWRAMKSRCLNSNDKYYRNYGGRGVFVCDDWLHDFAKFKQWAIGAGYKEGLSIDRIDNNSGYSPENCRWATRMQQQQNTRNNVLLTLHGKKLCIAEVARRLRVNYETMRHWIKKYGPKGAVLKAKSTTSQEAY